MQTSYFNREKRQRVWKAMTAQGDFSQATGTWTITGQQIATAPLFGGPAAVTQPTPGPITIHLTDTQCDMDSPITPAASKSRLLAESMPPRILPY